MLIKQVLIFIYYSLLFCGYARLSFAIRCESSHLPLEDVRQVISLCSRRFNNEISYNNKNSEMANNNPDERFDSRNRHKQQNHYQNQHESLQPSHFSNANASSTSQDEESARACILQCFFEEFKMVNQEGFPDKRKMADVLTLPLARENWELRNFYLNAIDQCFHNLDYEARFYVDKCHFSRRILLCLAEMAKINCSDYDNETLLAMM